MARTAPRMHLRLLLQRQRGAADAQQRPQQRSSSSGDRHSPPLRRRAGERTAGGHVPERVLKGRHAVCRLHAVGTVLE